ncbi:hypothetical protein ABZ569_10680 [Streptomyces albus]|uniref:hypothetical protein n=1 Tax=Streptomyces albus TaxID=1888 RepID=UPI0033FBA879
MSLDPSLHQSLLTAIPKATARGRKALADWNAVSGSLCDDNNEPLGERYNVRQKQRNAEAWDSFEPFLDHGPRLLAHTEEDFRTLYSDYENPDLDTNRRRRSQLNTLHTAIKGGRRVRDRWELAHETVPPEHPNDQHLLLRVAALRNAEGWHYAIAWADNADVLVEIDQATRARPTPAAGHAHTAQFQAARTEQSAPRPSSPSRSPRSR